MRYLLFYHEVKCSLTELTTIGATAVNIVVSGLLYLCMHWIPHALGCRGYSLVWREEGAFSVGRLVVFSLPSTFHFLSV